MPVVAGCLVNNIIQLLLRCQQNVGRSKNKPGMAQVGAVLLLKARTWKRLMFWTDLFFARKISITKKGATICYVEK